MILVILGICIIATILSWIFLEKTDGGAAIAFVFLSGCGLVTSLFATIALGVNVLELSMIDSKITMYQEENTKIEQQVANVVTQYQEYETKTFIAVAPEDLMTLVSLYPELKSDKLVQKQIDVYVDNSKKIKSLKERQIDGKVVKWWLYFGGK